MVRCWCQCRMARNLQPKRAMTIKLATHFFNFFVILIFCHRQQNRECKKEKKQSAVPAAHGLLGDIVVSRAPTPEMLRAPFWHVWFVIHVIQYAMREVPAIQPENIP